MKTILALTLLLAVTTVNADWATVVETANHRYEIQVASFQITQNNGGEVIATAIGRTVSLNDNAGEFYQWYVTAQDCAREQGMLTVLSLNGSHLGNADMIFGGGTAASEIAELLCDVGIDRIMKGTDI